MAVDLNWLLAAPSPTADHGDIETLPYIPANTDNTSILLGCGPLGPLRRGSSGDWEFSCGRALIEASIFRILSVSSMTRYTHGEIPWLPEFGSQLRTVLHGSVDEATTEVARHHILEALQIWEPRISVRDVAIDIDERVASNVMINVTVYYDIVSIASSSAILARNMSSTLSIAQAA